MAVGRKNTGSPPIIARPPSAKMGRASVPKATMGTGRSYSPGRRGASTGDTSNEETKRPRKSQTPTGPFERARKRREADQAYRAYVTGIRGIGKNFQLRRSRSKSRLSEVGDSMFGRPFDTEPPLPQFIGEAWYKSANQVTATGVAEAIAYGTTVFDTDRTNFPPLWDSTLERFTIPPGLGGVWSGTGIMRWALDGTATGNRNVNVLLNGTTTIYAYRADATDAQMSLPIVFTYLFSEGDYFNVQVTQSSGGALDVVGGLENTYFSLSFEGVA